MIQIVPLQLSLMPHPLSQQPNSIEHYSGEAPGSGERWYCWVGHKISSPILLQSIFVSSHTSPQFECTTKVQAVHSSANNIIVELPPIEVCTTVLIQELLYKHHSESFLNVVQHLSCEGKNATEASSATIPVQL